MAYGLLLVSKPRFGEVTNEGPYPDWETVLGKLKLYEEIVAQKVLPLSESKITSIKVFGLPFEFWRKNGNLYWRIKWQPFYSFLNSWKNQLRIHEGFIVQTKDSEGIFITTLGSINDYLIRLIW